MAELKITDVLRGKEGKVGLVIELGQEKFVYSSKGLTTFAEHGVSAAAVTGPKAEFIIQQSLIDLASKTKDLPATVKDALPSVSALYADADTGLVALLNKKAALVAAAEKGAAEEIQLAAEALPKGIAPKDVLSADLVSKAEKAGFDFTAFEKNAAEAASKLAVTEKVTGELKTLFEAKTLDVKAINKHLIANYEHLDELAILEAPKGYNLQEAIDGIRSEVSHLTAQAEGHYREYTKLSNEAKLATAKGETAAAKTFEANAESALKNAQKISAGDYGAAVKKGVSKDVIEAIELHNPTEAKTLGAAATEIAEKSGRGFVAKVLYKSESKLFEIANKEGKAISELGFTKKVSGFKAGGIAAGAVALAYVAGVGRNPDKGKYTEQLAAQQQNPQQGLSVG